MLICVGRIALFVALLFCAVARAKIDLPEPMDSIDRQTKYLLYLQSEIPALFEQGAEYDVDFFNLIKSQDSLVSVLSMDREWVQMAEARPPLMELEVSVPQKVRTIAREFQFDLLNKEIEENEIRGRADDLKNLIHRLDNAMGSRSLISALMNLLSPEQRREGHKKTTLSEKIRFLRIASVEAGDFRAKFKPDRAGLAIWPKNWAQAVDWAEERHRVDLSIAASLLANCLKEFTKAECRKLYESDQRFWNPIISGLKLSHREDGALESLREHLQETFSLKVNSSSQDFLQVVRLVEVPPFVGIFRGLVGADCSTSLSFPFVYMPGERTYFLYSPDGRLLGYLMGTLVSGPDQRSFLYVHTISGPYLSRRVVEAAVYGLQKSANNLGFSDVLIANHQNAHRNINYVAIHGFLDSIRSEATVAISYQDGMMRHRFAEDPTLSGYFNLQFDGPAANRSAAYLNAAVGEMRGLEISLSKAKVEPIHFNRKLSLAEAMLTALDLLAAENSTAARAELRDLVAEIRDNHMAVGSIDYSSRRRAARQILAPFNIRLPEMGRLAISDFLANNSAEDLVDYYRRIERVFAEYSIDLDNVMIEKRRPYLFLEGHLKAPDATETADPQMRKRTILFAIQMLKRWANPSLAYSVIMKNPSFFVDSKKFVNFVESLFDGMEAEYRILVRLHDSGFNFNSFDVQELLKKTKSRSNEVKNPEKEDPIQIMTSILENIKVDQCESTLAPRRR